MDGLLFSFVRDVFSLTGFVKQISPGNSRNQSYVNGLSGLESRPS